MSFQIKKLSKKSRVGEQLFRARESYGVSRQEVARELRISEKILMALEEGDMCEISGEMYREQFLKAYSSYLGFSGEEVVKEYTTEKSLYGMVCNDEQESVQSFALARTRLWVAPRIAKNAIFCILGVSIVSYLGFLGYRAVAPPELIVTSPPEHISLHTDRVLVSGKTEKEAAVLINGQAVGTGEDGTFNQEVILREGLNEITISSAKRFSKERSFLRTVLVTRKGQVTARLITGLRSN